MHIHAHCEVYMQKVTVYFHCIGPETYTRLLYEIILLANSIEHPW